MVCHGTHERLHQALVLVKERPHGAYVDFVANTDCGYNTIRKALCRLGERLLRYAGLLRTAEYHHQSNLM